MTIREHLQGSGQLHPKPRHKKGSPIRVEYHLDLYKVLIYDNDQDRAHLQIAQICGQLVTHDSAQIERYVGTTSSLQLADGSSVDIVVEDTGGCFKGPSNAAEVLASH